MKGKYLLTALTMGLAASPSFGALTINSPWGPSDSEKNLYEVLNSNFGKFPNSGGSLLTAATVGGAATDQQTWTASVGGTLGTLIVEYAGYAGQNVLGVYDPNNISHQLSVFTGGQAAGATDSLTVSLNGGGQYVLTDSHGSLTLASGSTFGFYFASGSGTTYYSQDAHNGDDNGVAHGNPVVQHIATFDYTGFQVLAMEDKSKHDGSDFDYNDMVVKISAVPEPTTVIAGALLLLPFGASTLRMVRRNRAS